MCACVYVCVSTSEVWSIDILRVLGKQLASNNQKENSRFSNDMTWKKENGKEKTTAK